jgi:hypothetical protein
MKIPPIEIKVRDRGRVRVDPNDDLIFKNEDIRDVDFSGLKCKRIAVINTRFERCHFEKLKLNEFSFGAGRETSEYFDCSFDEMRVHNMGSGYARFVRCTFGNVDLREWYGWGTELIDCTLSGRLRGGIFSGTVREDSQSFLRRKHNAFHGNDFSGMALEDVAFRNGIDLSLQKLPNEPGYLYLPEAEASIRRARADVITWRDLKLRQEAMAMIQTLEFEASNGQRQLLLHLGNYEKSTREVDEAVFALLRGT